MADKTLWQEYWLGVVIGVSILLVGVIGAAAKGWLQLWAKWCRCVLRTKYAMSGWVLVSVPLLLTVFLCLTKSSWTFIVMTPVFAACVFFVLVQSEAQIRRLAEDTKVAIARAEKAEAEMIALKALPKPAPYTDPSDIVALLFTWMRGRGHSENLKQIDFVETDKVLRLPMGSTEKYIEDAAAQLDYEVSRRGPRTILFRRKESTASWC